MKFIALLLSLFWGSNFCFSQSESKLLNKDISKKGSFYAYWGWNHDKFTKSNIHFIGDHYDFILHKVKAVERQSPLGYDPYLKINQITIPQYNFRIGYFINNHINISIGADHMKYVMVQNQSVKIDGIISNSGTAYDGVYKEGSTLPLTKDFLKFEHTDGLNYLNAEINRFHCFDKSRQPINLSYTYGIGVGLLYPRSDVTLLNNARNDEFHIAGYGISTKAGLNFTIYKYFFLQTELKAGFINMPNIRTTMNQSDKAKQHFGFLQGIAVIGFNLPVF